MLPALHHIVEALTPLLIAFDPIGLLPIFVSLTKGMTATERRVLSVRSVFVATLIVLSFMLAGEWLFRLLGITLPDFQIAGGILLLFLAVTDLLIQGKPMVYENQMVGLVPLALPLMAGPAVLTTTLVLAGRSDIGRAYTTVALLSVSAVVLATLLLAEAIVKFVGKQALDALSKLIMVLLAAIAVSYLRSGVVAIFMEHGR